MNRLTNNLFYPRLFIQKIFLRFQSFSNHQFFYFPIILTIGMTLPLVAQNKKESTSDFQPLAGPMISYTGMREVQIWLQWDTNIHQITTSTFNPHEKSTSSIQIQYKEKPSKSNSQPAVITNSTQSNTMTNKNQTHIQNDSNFGNKILYQLTDSYTIDTRTGIVNIPVSLLEPGTRYEYKIFANNKEIKFNYPLEFKTKPLWQWRNNPPNVKFAIGSCNYVNEENYDRPGQKWGKGFDIFETIRKDQPEFFVWMGDNVYLREADWDSQSGILHRYSHTRQKKEMQAMLSSMFHLAIWDDHDFGPNDASSSYGLSNITESIFKDFWPDPSYPNKGIYRSYSWSDIEFFLLDNRTFRTANSNYYSKDRTALGKVQKEWLFNSLSDSKARVKFIVLGGQFINSAKVYENLSNYEEDREEILDFIQKMKIAGVIFLSGDRHHSELSRLDRGNLYPIYEWTISPLTAGLSTTTESEPNQHRVKDSFVTERAYGLIEVEGIGKNRKIQFVTKNTFGKELYRMEIPISNLEKVE